MDSHPKKSARPVKPKAPAKLDKPSTSESPAPSAPVVPPHKDTTATPVNPVTGETAATTNTVTDAVTNAVNTAVSDKVSNAVSDTVSSVLSAALNETHDDITADTSTKETGGSKEGGDATAPEKSGKTRVQTNASLGISISSARVRRHLDKMTVNAKLDSMIADLKNQLAPFKTAEEQLKSGKIVTTVEKEVGGKKVSTEESRDVTDAEKAAATKLVENFAEQAKTIEAKVAALSRERTRFSNKAFEALPIVCDELIYQLVDYAASNVVDTTKKNKTNIHKIHLHKPGVEKLSLYPLVKSLPSFVAAASKFADDQARESLDKTLKLALTEAEKRFRTKYDIKRTKKDVAPNPAKKEQDSDTEAAVPAYSKTSFRFYVYQVCKRVIEDNPAYKSMRISTEICVYLSDLLVEFIQRLAPLVLLTTNSMKNKTVNDFAIMRTVETLLIDGHQPVETIELVPEPAKTDNAAAKLTFTAVKTISYPTSGYAALAEKVQQKLKQHSLAKRDAAATESDSE